MERMKKREKNRKKKTWSSQASLRHVVELPQSDPESKIKLTIGENADDEPLLAVVPEEKELETA